MMLRNNKMLLHRVNDFHLISARAIAAAAASGRCKSYAVSTRHVAKCKRYIDDEEMKTNSLCSKQYIYKQTKNVEITNNMLLWYLDVLLKPLMLLSLLFFPSFSLALTLLALTRNYYYSDT